VKVPVLRYYNVFNAEQVEGVEIPDAVKFVPIDFKPIDEAEKIAAGDVGGPGINHDGGQQAYYRPSTDSVHLPERTRFASCEEYYVVARVMLRSLDERLISAVSPASLTT
jgi:antirestriction protein ArdC